MPGDAVSPADVVTVPEIVWVAWLVVPPAVEIATVGATVEPVVPPIFRLTADETGLT